MQFLTALIKQSTSSSILKLPNPTLTVPWTVPIPNEVAFALRLQRIHQAKVRLVLGETYQNQDLVFSTSKGTPINPRGLIRKFHEIRKDAGLSTESTKKEQKSIPPKREDTTGKI